MANNNLAEFQKFIENNPHVSMQAMWQMSDLLYNLPEDVVSNTKVNPTDNGCLFTVLDVKDKPVCVYSSREGISVLDNIGGKLELRAHFSDRVPMEFVCEEVMR